MKHTVCIDAGHGGKDSGAVGSKEVEKNINLQIANMLNEKLALSGVACIMTRKGDEYATLADRCNIANKAQATIFISIHANSATNKSAKGVETWVYKNEGQTNKLAEAVHNKLNVGRKDRGIKENGFAVLTGTKMPAILVELGFISNDEDQAYMMQNIDHMATCIYDGIIAYLGIEKPVEGTTDDTVSTWAEKAWRECKELGILDGTRPKDNISREEMSVVVSRILKITGVM